MRCEKWEGDFFISLVNVRWFGPTGQGKLRQQHIARRKSGFLFRGRCDLSLCSIFYEWGMRENPHS